MVFVGFCVVNVPILESETVGRHRSIICRDKIPLFYILFKTITDFFCEFFTVCPDEKENKLFIGPKGRQNRFWISKKFVFFFNCSSWESFVEKNLEHQDLRFDGLMS